MLEPQGALGTRAYTLAVDIQLLKAYEPGWLTLTLDEKLLVDACAEWPRIKAKVERLATRSKAGRLPLGLFMLWPRIVDDLHRWDELDADKRLTIARATFAMSSVGFSDWFIREAVRVCPDLDSELGRLLVQPEDILAQKDRDDDSGQDSAWTQLNKSDMVQDADAWPRFLRRLDDLSAELKEHPTQEAVAELAALVRDVESLCSTLPHREQPAAQQLGTHIEGLLDHLRSLSIREGFDWLDADLISHIEARWKLAAGERLGEEQIEALAGDAVAAVERSNVAAEDLVTALGEVARSRTAVADADALLEAAKGFVEQTAGKRKRAEALKRQLDAESEQQAEQERLIDAASPFGAPFDYSCDYRALLEGITFPAAACDSDRPPPPEQDDAMPLPEQRVLASQEEPQGNTTAPAEILPTLGTAEPSFVIEPAEAISSARQPQEVPQEPPLPYDGGGASLQPADRKSIDDDQPYNDAAGEACRPIWQLLSRGQASMAFHAASWIGDESPGLTIPSPDLLAAVALEGALMLPDGGVQSAMSARFERLQPEVFAAQTPRAWRTAINLLLASATLRAMILAPGTGAGSVAAYLHQDGNYPALYALVQQLRELSPLLMGFRIEPAVLRRARSEASIRADLQALQHAAEDWLRVQAPAYTIKFAAATGVWRHWLHAGGEIDALVTPVVHNRIAEVDRVRERLATMSDHAQVLRLIHDTDRKTLKRRRGEDIHAGALDHLLRNVEEALRLPRQWLNLVELLGQEGDRMRDLLERVHTGLRESQRAVEDELLRVPEHDPWGLVQAGQAQALRAMRSVLSLFDAAAELPTSEPTPAEVLGRPLLLIADLPLREDWSCDSQPAAALESLSCWLSNPLSADDAVRTRLERGDVLGAEMLVQAGMIEPQSIQIRQDRERWKQALRKDIAECRRAVEIGSAYGYLVDADRGQFESRLALWEVQLDDVRRFDVALTEIREIRTTVDQAREARAQQVREAMRDVAVTEEMRATVEDVERALGDGDIATANELTHWLVQGRPVPTELDGESQEGFDKYFPTGLQAIESWLGGQRRDAIEQALRQGQAVPGIDVQHVAGAQRGQAAKMFGAWLDIKAQQGAEQSRLEPLMTGLGFTVKSLSRTEKVAGREAWALDVQPVEDRHICPLPMFGSAAGGKYRVVCVWGRPTEDELLQWVGDSTVSRPTLLLYFGRMTERKWKDLSRMSKTKRRAFALLDETLLVYLCYAAGSRLRAWFDVSLPFSFSSPYDATAGLVPPELFYGRGAELDAVRGPNGRCFIYGGRQLGKTALLKRAEQSFHASERGHYAKWIDLRAEGIGVSRAAAEVWITLHEKLKELGVLDARIAVPVPGKKQGVEGVIRGVREFLTADSDRRVLLLLDEADRFFEQDGRSDFENTRRLKQLMDETSRRFKVVFAGLHNVLRMTERPNHPLAHFGEPIEIGPLREGDEVREAADLIRRPMAAAGFEFESRALVIRILAQTNYYPSLIQLYCSHLLRHMLSQIASRQRVNGPRYVVTDRDIEQVYSSDALRDEIRAKFRLTLQLDPRYEVVAYAMALDLLRSRYSQTDGMPWQTIRQSGAMYWWPEGFRDTSELDFRVLLDEMVGLGVLRRREAGHYVLRNPNVLLLLGNQEEIEAVLVKDREPAVEFESASFRPPLRRSPAASDRNAFTYQQLSRLLQRANNITVVTGTPAAGIGDVVTSLQDYLGKDAAPVVLSDCTDRHSFGNALSAALLEREKDFVTAFIVPDTTPWTDLWLVEARQRLERLKSTSKFASLVFVAEPATLWRLLRDETSSESVQSPWMSLLHWRDEFLRHWLEERQLQLEHEDRRRLSQVTGCWPALLLDLAGDCTELRMLRERMITADDRWFSNAEQAASWQDRLGLNVSEPVQTISLLARLGEPVDVNELALVGEMEIERVQASLRWGELLGLTRSEGASLWTVDPIAAKALILSTAS
ncbi:ATP-binding protein [Burkholderia gladioli]|uniref:ATP-binding protein n=1 Tax=Burkholderia gladioli TaxID=28095 RepID=UPI0022D21C4B|nr:ATP-binding protein [Burkholderia gladioli]MDA0576180.1 ATP-binding protein [Burkholderia gladioli]MDA0604274.1 ATP-binding protein [Burkholderia gladioli]